MIDCICCKLKSDEHVTLSEKRRAMEQGKVCLSCLDETTRVDVLELTGLNVYNSIAMIGLSRYMAKSCYATLSVVPLVCTEDRRKRARGQVDSTDIRCKEFLKFPTTPSCGSPQGNTPCVAKTRWYDYGRYKFSAERRGKEWNLTMQEYYELVNYGECFYCHRRFNHAIGIDRFDNSIGYTYSNCVPCCATCNYAKGTKDAHDYLEEIHGH